MSQGLQCWDEDGNLVLDVTDRLTSILGTFSTGTTSGSISNPGLSGGTPWYCFPSQPLVQALDRAELMITFSGNTLSWDYGTGTVISYRIIYGVY